MAVTQRLEVRQTQSLVMTPQLQQAIKLLQMSNLELGAFVDEEIERNPLLERDDGDESPHADSEPREVEPDTPDRDESPRDASELTASDELPDQDSAPLDTDHEGVFDNPAVDDWTGEAPWGQGGGSGSLPVGEAPERQLSESVSLRQHLQDQLQLELSDPIERLIGLHLIDQLDDAGYLRDDLDALAELLGCEPSLIDITLSKLQRFDPSGIFARDLRECLALQLADRDRLDPAMQALLDQLDLIPGGSREQLRQICQVDDEDLTEMIAEIKALNPKPATAFDFESIETLIPDILMRRHRAGGWILELNSDTLPRVLVNNTYYARVSKRMSGKADKEYLTEQLQSATWLARSLHQRATTILKAATEIVRKQDAFFQKGVLHLRPLTLREVAEAVEMHESTISRVTSNKYIATPRGILELKYFFTSAIPGTGGGEHSALAVRDRIKRLIDTEPPNRVLSDDSIVNLLRQDGVAIARRTVAKYREVLRIPSSVERRRAKAAS